MHKILARGFVLTLFCGLAANCAQAQDPLIAKVQKQVNAIVELDLCQALIGDHAYIGRLNVTQGMTRINGGFIDQKTGDLAPTLDVSSRVDMAKGEFYELHKFDGTQLPSVTFKWLRPTPKYDDTVSSHIGDTDYLSSRYLSGDHGSIILISLPESALTSKAAIGTIKAYLLDSSEFSDASKRTVPDMCSMFLEGEGSGGNLYSNNILVFIKGVRDSISKGDFKSLGDVIAHSDDKTKVGLAVYLYLKTNPAKGFELLNKYIPQLNDPDRETALALGLLAERTYVLPKQDVPTELRINARDCSAILGGKILRDSSDADAGAFAQLLKDSSF